MLNVNHDYRVSILKLILSSRGRSKSAIKLMYRSTGASVDSYQYLRFDCMPHKNRVVHWQERWLRQYLYVTGILTNNAYMYPTVFRKYTPNTRQDYE